MDAPRCHGCHQRDAIIGALEARVANLEEENAKLQHTIQGLKATRHRLTERLAQYEPEIKREGHETATLNEDDSDVPGGSYSLDAETQRRRRRHRHRRKKSPGRQPTARKFAAVERFQEVYPGGVYDPACRLVRERAIWRLENGRAVRIGYRIFARPGQDEPRIPGVTPRCEYGIEILVVLAFLTYVIGISLDKACAVLAFFCQLPLAKSEADALLRQLAQHWQGEFELLCDLIAHAAVVQLDETGWNVGGVGCSLWALASKCQRVFLFGCHKDDATLDKLLPPDVFRGIGVSDDAAVYRNRFVQAQKCWAHLLRKAIRLALLYPETANYQRFLDRLLQLYYDAQRASEDGRLGEAGRIARVTELEGQLCELCGPYYDRPAAAGQKPHEQDFSNLVDELIRLMEAEELFTFVLHPEVAATNNSMERELRGSALDRKAGRTNQTATGAHRRSIIVSVLESLRANLTHFDLASVLAEINRWQTEGISLFAEQWESAMAKECATANTS